MHATNKFQKPNSPFGGSALVQSLPNENEVSHQVESRKLTLTCTGHPLPAHNTIEKGPVHSKNMAQQSHCLSARAPSQRVVHIVFGNACLQYWYALSKTKFGHNGSIYPAVLNQKLSARQACRCANRALS